jgi:hypothetical protein
MALCKEQGLEVIGGIFVDRFSQEDPQPWVQDAVSWTLKEAFGELLSPEIKTELTKANSLMNRAVAKLRAAGKETAAGLLEFLYPRTLPYLLDGRKSNPLQHTAQVVDFMVDLSLNENLPEREAQKAVATALLHDIGYARSKEGKIRKADIDAEQDREKKEALRQQAIQARKAHMDAGAEIAGELLAQSPDLFTPGEVQEIQAVIRIHDNPSIQEYEEVNDGKWLLPPDNQLAQFLREADRLWMLSEEGIEIDLQRDKRKTGLRDAPKRIADNIERHLQEGALYYQAKGLPVAPNVYGFKGFSLYRTETGFLLFKFLIRELCRANPELAPFLRTKPEIATLIRFQASA